MMTGLVPLASDAFVFAAAVNSLVFVQLDNAGHTSGVLIVDTGLDESHARKLLRALEAEQLRPSAILNTHSHADHHGGNATILKRFPELPIYAPPLEAAIIQHPILEPLYLYGAHPPKALQNKFLLAPATQAQAVGTGHLTLGGVDIELIEVSGHASQMYAVRRREVLYAADALFGEGTLSKHPLTFCVDSAAMKWSAERLLSLEGVQLSVPSHGAPTHDLGALVAANLKAFERVTNAVLSAVEQACSVDTALARVCQILDVEMTTPATVVLNRSVISAHLAELAGLGVVELRVEGNQLLFVAV